MKYLLLLLLGAWMFLDPGSRSVAAMIGGISEDVLLASMMALLAQPWIVTLVDG